MQVKLSNNFFFNTQYNTLHIIYTSFISSHNNLSKNYLLPSLSTLSSCIYRLLSDDALRSSTTQHAKHTFNKYVLAFTNMNDTNNIWLTL